MKMAMTEKINRLNELKAEYQNLRNGNAVVSVQLNTAAVPFLIKNRVVINRVLDLLIAECQTQIHKELSNE